MGTAPMAASTRIKRLQTGASTDGRSSRAKTLRKERREQILAAGRRVFAEKGYHAASITDVIEAADVARGTFYLYFDSKREIFETILDDLLERLTAVIHRVELGPGHPPILEQLHGNVERVIQVLLSNRDLPSILRRTAIGIDEDFDRKLTDFYARITGLIERALLRGMQQGLLRPLNPNLIAKSILGSFKELAVYSATASLEDPAQLRAFSDELIRYNMEGILKR
ncbi:MAG: TetR/AcrR family transcriptional regulator [Bdellovibrionota bacterium]